MGRRKEGKGRSGARGKTMPIRAIPNSGEIRVRKRKISASFNHIASLFIFDSKDVSIMWDSLYSFIKSFGKELFQNVL